MIIKIITMFHSGPNIKMVMMVMALILGTFPTFISIGNNVAYGSGERNDPWQDAGFADGQSMMSVAITVGLIPKDSCQIVYQDKGKITFHVIRRLMHPLVVVIRKRPF
jgi:hypothetical protein